jgi:hypothetical protein
VGWARSARRLPVLVPRCCETPLLTLTVWIHLSHGCRHQSAVAATQKNWKHKEKEFIFQFPSNPQSHALLPFKLAVQTASHITPDHQTFTTLASISFFFLSVDPRLKSMNASIEVQAVARYNFVEDKWLIVTWNIYSSEKLTLLSPLRDVKAYFAWFIANTHLESILQNRLWINKAHQGIGTAGCLKWHGFKFASGE